ncbi:MAG: DUF4998 domain-containing protein [Tannerella sp.]|nr:DUF4998 domain-containing protein [Tannerella sp.]
MKKFIELIKQTAIAVAALAALYSCSEMNDKHEQYLDGEIIYAAMVDSAFMYPGRERAEIEVLIRSQRIETVRIFWNSYSDSTDLDINGQVGTFSTTIEDLLEQDYIFNVVSIDEFGNRSLPVEVSGRVYGDNYQSGLIDRSIRWISPTANGLTVQWGSTVSSVAGVEIVYTNIEGNSQTFRASAEETIVIPGWKSGFSYHTIFSMSGAIDEFDKGYETVVSDEDIWSLTPKYSWSFDDPANPGNPDKEGAPIELVGNVTLIDGPDAANKAVRVEIGKENYLKVSVGTPMQQWTLMVVFRAPNDISSYHTILQTDPANSNDADFFIRDGNVGIGALGGYVGPALEADKWYRLIITRNTSLKISSYVNKVRYQNGANASDGRFNLQSTFLISGDESNEDKTLDVAEIGVWDKFLDEFVVNRYYQINE